MTEQSAQWWKSAVIYQIYPRSFQDSNGDGIGDLGGIAQRLEYLAWLGVDAIWLSPIYESPMADFGYDVSDFRKIDPIFGTLEDFDALVAAAHAHSIKVIMDFVPNHTSSQHAWFLESRASRDNPKRDWYIWADPTEAGDPPNNWMAYFGGSAWTFDEKTKQYYLHNFLPEQPDLNYRNQDAKNAVWNDMRFWLDRGVDGFRLDVIDRMLKDPGLRDNPTNPEYVQGFHNPTQAFLRIHSEGYDGIHDLIRECQHVIKAYENRVSIGEIQYYADPTKMVAFYGDHESDELDLPFNFGLLLHPWQADEVCNFVNTYDEAVPAHGWPNYVLGNHDQHRLASRVGAQGARVAAMLLLTLRGTPFIYNGEELGMENVNIPQHLVQDPQGRNMPGFTRDVARTPMQWSGGEHAGFSTVAPWLPLEERYAERNVEAEKADSHSILTLYHKLIEYRRKTPALLMGTYTRMDATPTDVFAYLRANGDQRVLIALNFGDMERTAVFSDLKKADTGRLVLSTLLDREEAAVLSALRLRPNEGIIVEL